MTSKRKNLRPGLRGFTIIETLVAILLLTTALTGPLTIAAKGLSGALESRDQLTASYLAQDAVEYLRYARDTNCLRAGVQAGGCPLTQWLAGNGNGAQTINLTPCESANGCYLDSTNNSPTAPTACGSTCSVLYYENSVGDYDYNNGTGTTVGTPSFVRTITLTEPNGSTITGTPSEVALTVTVTWREPSGPQTVSVREELFDWQ